jgi:hypothetical protein
VGGRGGLDHCEGRDDGDVGGSSTKTMWHQMMKPLRVSASREGSHVTLLRRLTTSSVISNATPRSSPVGGSATLKTYCTNWLGGHSGQAVVRRTTPWPTRSNPGILRWPCAVKGDHGVSGVV